MEDSGYKKALKFGWLTRLYDPFMKITGAYRVFNNAILSGANIKDNDAILDFGCGTGNLIIELKRKTPKALVYGIDIDPNILRIAKDKIKDSGYQIQLKIYDGVDFPFKDKTFDKVLSNLVFHHLSREQKKSTIQEIYRILKPGGELHILDFGKASNIFMRIMFTPIRLFDGFDNTYDNIKGLLPKIVKEAGYTKVTEHKRMVTPLGNISLYRAIK